MLLSADRTAATRNIEMSMGEGPVSPGSGYVMPGEFEPHSAIWLGWPSFQWFTGPRLDTRQTISEILQTLSDNQVTANILCTDKQKISEARHWMRDNGWLVTPYMNFLAIPQVDIWIRDYGPIFLKNRTTHRLAIASFTQNQWGYSRIADNTSVRMSGLPDLVARYLGINTVLRTRVVSEGGGRIHNGRGTLLVCRSVEFQRNPYSTKAELEAAYKTMLGATRIIWLNAGLYEDLQADKGPIPYVDTEGNTIFLYGPQTTGGHLDELCQFTSPVRIILAQVTGQEASSDPVAAANYLRLEEIYRVLSAEMDMYGNPLDIIRIPTPDIDYMQIQPDEPMYSQFLVTLDYPDDAPVFPDGEPVHIVRASSYANYFVTNGLVIAPKYGNQAKDDAAASALKTAYPGRDVVQIDPTPLNYTGGGIHCLIQQQPVGIY